MIDNIETVDIPEPVRGCRLYDWQALATELKNLPDGKAKALQIRGLSKSTFRFSVVVRDALKRSGIHAATRKLDETRIAVWEYRNREIVQ